MPCGAGVTNRLGAGTVRGHPASCLHSFPADRICRALLPGAPGFFSRLTCIYPGISPTFRMKRVTSRSTKARNRKVIRPIAPGGGSGYPYPAIHISPSDLGGPHPARVSASGDQTPSGASSVSRLRTVSGPRKFRCLPGFWTERIGSRLLGKGFDQPASRARVQVLPRHRRCCWGPIAFSSATASQPVASKSVFFRGRLQPAPRPDFSSG